MRICTRTRVQTRFYVCVYKILCLVYIYQMKYALQIYGVFRTFETCLPQILRYIMYDQLDYDVYILSQRADGYSSENERKIRQMLGSHSITWRYIEDYPDEVHQEEDRACVHYQTSIAEARRIIQSDLITNDFVTRLWYRRWLNNQMRHVSGVTYDWVVRTRFDIGYRTVLGRRQLDFLAQPPPSNSIYLFPDIISCGSPSAIDYESDLIHHWPYLYQQHQLQSVQPSRPPLLGGCHETIKKWLFMSEMNLVHYLKDSTLQVNHLSTDLKIVRSTMVPSTVLNVGSNHIAHVYYGCEDRWVEVTETFWLEYVNHYNFSTQKGTVVVNNSLSRGDPYPGEFKSLVITTLEDCEMIYPETANVTFQYQHLSRIICPSGEIKRVTYGWGTKIVDITQTFLHTLARQKLYVFVSNLLSGQDPCPGHTKVLSIVLQSGKCYQVGEYTLILWLG